MSLPSPNCPDGRCDGSGFLFDEVKRVARPCSCRPARLARKKASAVQGRLPKRFREVSFDREPMLSMERRAPHVIDRSSHPLCLPDAVPLFSPPPGTASYGGPPSAVV